MADTKISALTAVTTPDGASEFAVNEAGTSKKISLSQVSIYSDPLTSTATATQNPFAADAYVSSSSILIPQARMGAGVAYYCRMMLTKTAAGIATPTYTLRYGTAGTAGDAARCSFTQTSAQTAAADTAWIELLGTFRVFSSVAVIVATIRVTHDLASTGFVARAGYVQNVVSGTFDATVANSKIGMSINGGASASWTLQQCIAQLHNLAA